MKRLLVLLLSLSIVSAGCSSASGGRVPVQMPTASDTTTMADFVQKLPPGSRVRVDRTDGNSVKATLMRATAQSITIQARTRVAEPPIEIPLNTVTRVAVENGNGTSTGKAIAIGIAVGAGTFLGILAIFAAAFND